MEIPAGPSRSTAHSGLVRTSASQAGSPTAPGVWPSRVRPGLGSALALSLCPAPLPPVNPFLSPQALAPAVPLLEHPSLLSFLTSVYSPSRSQVRHHFPRETSPRSLNKIFLLSALLGSCSSHQHSDDACMLIRICMVFKNQCLSTPPDCRLCQDGVPVWFCSPFYPRNRTAPGAHSGTQKPEGHG